MHCTSLVTTVGRMAVAIGILAGLLLLSGAGTAAAEEREAPIITAALSNAPRQITVAWFHEEAGVYGYAVQLKLGDEWRDAQRLDHTYGQHTLADLEPETWYTLRVCAVYDPDGVERECSEPEVSVQTQAPEQPGQQPPLPTPRIVSHDAGETWITIRWEAGYNYDSYYITYREGAAPGEGAPTIKHAESGTGDDHRFDGLVPGRGYFFAVRGCNDNLGGLLGDFCHDWSEVYEASTLPSPLPLPMPVLRAEPAGAGFPNYGMVRLTWVNPLDDAQRALLTGMDWYRDGKHIYRGTDTIAREDAVRPNSGPYRYQLCVKSVADEQCSDEVSAAPTPVPPSTPSDVKVTWLIGVRGSVQAEWFSGDVPGTFFTVERLGAHGGTDENGIDYGGFAGWVELGRIDARDTSTYTDRVDNSEESAGPQSEYRVCAVVPALGETGKACSAPVTAGSQAAVSMLPIPGGLACRIRRDCPEETPALPYGPDTCKQGYVWREAFDGDTVCVTPERRSQVRADNAQAAARREPNGGPYGPDTCKQGFVWREARESDVVCVTPAERSLVASENATANERRVVPR